MLVSILFLEMNIIIYFMWFRFFEKVKIVFLKYRNFFVKDFNEYRIIGLF